MERAGGAVAAAVARAPRAGIQVVVLAGPGNNGGDGFIAARLLAAAGLPGSVDACWGRRHASRGRSCPLQKSGRARLTLAAVSGFGGADVIIDALFGAGLDRPVEEPAAVLD